MEMFGRTTKFINHPSLMPDPYKDLDDNRNAVVDKQCQWNQLDMLPQVIHKQHLKITICSLASNTLCRWQRVK